MGKGSKQRLVPLGSYACRAITAYLNAGRGELEQRSSAKIPERRALFLNKRGKRISRQSVWEIVKATGERAGITKPLHTFFVTLLTFSSNSLLCYDRHKKCRQQQ